MYIRDRDSGLDDWAGFQQLRMLVEKAGFEFELIAEGHVSIPIDGQALCGSTSTGDGAFQGFYVCLGAAADRIAAGVKYSLRPKRKSVEYFWTVLPEVVLRRPDGKGDHE